MEIETLHIDFGYSRTKDQAPKDFVYLHEKFAIGPFFIKLLLSIPTLRIVEVPSSWNGGGRYKFQDSIVSQLLDSFEGYKAENSKSIETVDAPT